MTNVNITGIAAVNANLNKKITAIEATNARTVKTAAFDLVAQTMEQITLNKSVITGTLRRSINARKREELVWSVGTNVEYAPFVEARKPYMQPSLDMIGARYPMLITSDLRGVV